MSQSPVHKKIADLYRSPLKRVWARFLRVDSRIHTLEFSISYIFALLLVVMIRQELPGKSLPVYNEGDIALRTVRATSLIEAQDPDSGQDEVLQLLARVSPVYDYDKEAVQGWIDQWKAVIRQLRKMPNQIARNPEVVSETFGFPISSQEASFLAKLNYSLDLERSIVFSMGPVWDQRIIEKRPTTSVGIELVELKAPKSTFLRASDMASLVTPEEVRSLVLRAAATEARSKQDRQKMPWTEWPLELRTKVFALQARLVRPNVTLNRKETEARRSLALSELKPLMLRVDKGEVIVREGERVGRKGAAILSFLNKKGQLNPARGRILLEAFFGAFVLWLSLLFVRRQFPKVMGNSKNTLVAGGLLLTTVATFKLGALFIMNVVAGYFGNIPPSFFLFLIPVAAPAMITRLLMKIPFATLFSLIFAAAIASMLDGAMAFGAHVLVVSLMSIHFLNKCPTRTSLHVAGLRAAVISGFSSLAVLAAWGGEYPATLTLFTMDAPSNFSLTSLGLWTFGGGFIGGWLGSVLTLVITPILENILDYTTDLKLLELARMDNPLLRDLVLKAPGTYHHSIVVGSLVEAACESVGANALLARVGSYYHDIGKLGKSEYFVENQSSGLNPHDQISPHMSAKIIISHVKQGKLMAQEAKLGEQIVEFIETHHGTSLVSYFFNKAKQEAAQPGSHVKIEEISEADFMYPGPKPQSKEAAIVALADSCEAATRSLVDPTPARIEGMVKKIISNGFNDGLLDDADITLREVNLVGQAFVRILLGIHHNRIQYPDQEKGLPQSKSPTLSFIKSRRMQ